MNEELKQLFQNDLKNVVYDIEVVDGYLIISMLNIETEEIKTLTNPSRKTVQKMLDTYNLIGFYNKRFDDRILEHYVSTPNVNLKQVSDAVINRELFLRRPQVQSLDITNLLQNQHAKSLKAWESSLGLEIDQATDLFDLPAEEQDLPRLIRYCENDVRATFMVLQVLQGELRAYRGLIDFIEQETGVRALESRNVLTKLLLTPDEGVSTTYRHKFLQNYLDNCNIEYKLPLFQDYIDFSTAKGFKKLDLEFIFSSKRSTNRKKKPESQYQPMYYSKAELDKVDAELGEYIASSGGNHGFWGNYCKKVYGADVSSLYPSVMRNINLFGELTPEYAKLIEIKNTTTEKDIKSAVKLVLNSTYGITRSEQVGEHLYTQFGVDTCIVGNIIFWDLKCRLENLNAKVLQTNTDAVFIDADSMDYEDFVAEIKKIENDYNVKMDLFTLNNYYALDVNNYTTDEKQKGIFADNKTIRDMKAFSIILEMLLRNNGELPLNWLDELTFDCFLRRAQATGEYYHARYDYKEVPRISEKTGKVLKGSDLLVTNERYIGKHIRSYVSHNKQETIILRSNGEKQTKLAKVPNEYMVCVNEKITSQEIPADLNVSWYVDEAKKRYDKWLTQFSENS